MALGRGPRKSANQHRRRSGSFSHNQSGRSRQAIGGRKQGYLQWMTIAVMLAAEIDERRHAGDSNHSIHEPLTPDSAECVRYNDPASENARQFASGTVWILRKKSHRIVAFNVGLINARIGANEPVMCLTNQNFVTHPNDAPRFT